MFHNSHACVQLAHAMDELEPMQQASDGEDMATDEDGNAALPTGGLATLFSMIMAGLAAQTPHMISASIMALARLLYEFAGSLQPLVPQLLPAVLLLLRTKSREVVKSVLGFIKVSRQPPNKSPTLERLKAANNMTYADS